MNATPTVPGLVSVVIPTYNRAALLEQAVRSCLEQTYKKVEVLIVDDGSSDDTSRRVEKLLKGDWAARSVRYWHTSNSGVSAARQFGLERARGEFVQFLDSDDLLLPHKFELQIKALRSHGDTTACCSCYGRKGPDKSGWDGAARIGFKGRTLDEFVHSMCSPQPFATSTNAPLWRREYLITQVGWPTHLTCGEDWAHYTRLLLQAKHVQFVDDELFWARDHQGDRLSNTANSPLRPPQVRAFALALKEVIDAVQGTIYFDSECRRGLLALAATIYALMLQADLSEDFEWYEKTVARLYHAEATGRKLRIISGLRRHLGPAATTWCLHKYLWSRRLLGKNVGS